MTDEQAFQIVNELKANGVNFTLDIDFGIIYFTDADKERGDKIIATILNQEISDKEQ